MSWTTVTTILIILILFSFALFLLNIMPPKFKTPGTPADHGLPYEDVRFTTSDGIQLAGWLIGNGSKPVILVGHGYPFDKANILPVTTFLYPAYNLFLFDMRSFGESKGTITTAGAKEVEDAKAAYQWLKKRGYKTIGAYGFSMSASVFLTSKLDFAAIVADSPYASLQRMIAHQYWWLGPLKWPLVWLTDAYSLLFFGIHPANVSPATAIKDVTAPVLLIHGTNDNQIPADNSKAIKNNAGENVELWLVKGGHGMSYASQPKRYKEKVRQFFKKHV